MFCYFNSSTYNPWNDFISKVIKCTVISCVALISNENFIERIDNRDADVKHMGSITKHNQILQLLEICV